MMARWWTLFFYLLFALFIHFFMLDTPSKLRGRGSISVRSFYYFFNFSNQQLIQYYGLSHYHYFIIKIISIIISSSHKKHSMIHTTPYFAWKPTSWGENHRSLYNNNYLATTGRRKQPLYYNDFNSLATTGRRLQPPDLLATT